VSNLGLLYVRTGKLDLAERDLNEALRLEPRSGETLARLGELALARGDLPRGKALFQQAQTLDPNNKRAAEGLAALKGK
jgi:Flp pilus assembly protein TadD